MHAHANIGKSIAILYSYLDFNVTTVIVIKRTFRICLNRHECGESQLTLHEGL